MNNLKIFLQKRWVRIIGIIPLSIYTYFAIMISYGLIADTVFRPPNKVFPGTDLIGWLGYMFFLGIILFSGIAAMVTAYFMNGIYRLLYISGGLAVFFALAFFPLNFKYTANYESQCDIPEPQGITGEWKNDWYQLTLREDSTFNLTHCWGNWFTQDTCTHYDGSWRFEKRNLYLTDPNRDFKMKCEIFRSQGYHFITYGIPENFDAWLGNLGMMR
ncbi:MAG: hypothetical protein GY841_06350, partial [FCB group bacterium]|nr:hypothetical protein [FCB group bacterium]